MTEPPADQPMTILVRMDRPVMADADKQLLTPLDVGLATIAPYLNPTDLATIRTRFAPWLGQPQHPLQVSNQFTDFAVPRAFPDLAPAAAFRHFARLAVGQYQKTILGRVLMAPIRLMGMSRILRQVPKQLAATSNYGTRQLAELGPQHMLYECEDEIMRSDVLAGYLEAAAELAGAADVQVQFSQRAPKHYAFDISWGTEPPVPSAE